MKYGYARISTKDQNLNMQIDALEKYGCQQIYSEQATGEKPIDQNGWNCYLKLKTAIHWLYGN